MLVFVLSMLCLLQGANQSPLAPVINEPVANGVTVSAADVHMETAPFSDPDVGDLHFCTDWEIWTAGLAERVWFTSCIQGVERTHTHFGDGSFVGSHAGRSELFPSSNYVLRVRHSDDSGDAATRWSAWSQRTFVTGAATAIFPLELDDIARTPPVTWSFAGTANPVSLPAGQTPARLVLESAAGALLYELAGAAGGTVASDAPALGMHDALRVRVIAGSTGMQFGASDLRLVDEHCERHALFLPAISLTAGASALFWISMSGATYFGNTTQTAPSFASLARAPSPPWSARQPGFEVEIVAGGFQLPVNIAFKPNAGSAPTDPLLYVTELHGKIKVVFRNRTVGTYAGNLLNFNPTSAFPGSGEQGVTGIVVDPASGDVIAAMLYAPIANPANHNPKLVRFSSTDGGRTAALATTILDMPGETQGQSHQISNLTLLPDGTLLCHMGDGFDAATSQNLSSFRGKILRLRLDGTPVPSNPFYNAGDGITARDYVYAYGVRNPFGGEWRASDGAHYIVENGPSIDRFAKLVMGRNYLWDGSDASMANFALKNWNPAVGPVNLAFVQPATFGGSGFPAAHQDRAFVTESGPTYAYGQNSQGKRITEWILDANGALVAGPIPFVEYTGSRRATVCGLEAGPDGLYFTDLYADASNSPTASGANLLRVFWRSVPDCNGNGADDACDLVSGTSPDSDLNGLPDECDCRGTNFCLPLQNSAGCTPSISATGSATLAGPDDLVVRATSVLNNRQGLLMWGTSSVLAPLGAGFRCVGAPVRRMPVQNSGGAASGTSCTGTYAQAIPDALFSANGFLAGQVLYFQWWSRDNGYSAPNNIGLTDGLRIMVCP